MYGWSVTFTLARKIECVVHKRQHAVTSCNLNTLILVMEVVLLTFNVQFDFLLIAHILYISLSLSLSFTPRALSHSIIHTNTRIPGVTPIFFILL